jgi:hypothetical protein
MAHSTSPNPFRGPARGPGWAELTRLAGDRGAILLMDLRRRISSIHTLQEEVVYNPERGWDCVYRAGNRTLFTLHVGPALLEATMGLEGALRERLLRSSRVGRALQRTLRELPLENGTVSLRVRLSNANLVRSFARLAAIKARTLAGV